MDKVNNRKVHLDLLRIIACFCVILIHSCIYGQSSEWSNQDASLLITNFYGILSRWAVPCFVMISGMMFLNNNKEIPLKKLYSKYILRLFISYVFWSCVYAIYNSFYEVSGGLKEQIQYIINNCFSGEIHMWYVLMIIGLYIAIPIIKYLVNNLTKNMLHYWIGCLFVFSSIIPFISILNIPFFSGVISYLNQYMEIYFLMGYTLYFVIGFYLDKYELTARTKKIIYILGALGFAYSIFVLIIFKYYFSLNIGALNYLYPNIVFYSVAVLLFFKDYVSKIDFSQKTKSIIVSISKLTYGIYLIHVLILKVLYHIGINISICNVAISEPLVSLITFIVSMVIIFIVSKIPIVNKYIC